MQCPYRRVLRWCHGKAGCETRADEVICCGWKGKEVCRKHGLALAEWRGEWGRVSDGALR